MSDFEFVLVEKIGFTLQQTVFEFVIGGGRGARGEAPTAQNIGDVIAAAEAKAILVDADGIGVSNSEDGDILVEWTYASLKAQLLAWLATVFLKALNYKEAYLDKGDSGTATQTVDVAVAGFQKITKTGDFPLAFSNIPAAGTAWSVTVEIVNGGVGSITLPAAMGTPGGLGLTLTASGTDFISVWGRNGTTQYHSAVNLDNK